MSHPSPSTNQELLSRLCSRGGRASDWQAFYAKYKDLVARWCLQFGVNPSDLDDIFHDILLKLVGSLAQYDPESGHRFRSWLKTVVLNALVDRLRVAQNNPFPSLLSDLRRIEATEPGSSSVPPNVDQLADELADQSTPAAQILTRARSRVTPATWDAFVRRDILDEPVAAIAESLGIKKASVYQSVSRVRNIIREESRLYFEGASDS